MTDLPDIQPSTDEDTMRLALKLAKQAADRDEVPVGAVVTCEGRIIARAFNQVELLKDATAHAEMLALTQAQNALRDWRLEKCTLFVTKEPCAMCAGAMMNCRLGRLVFGCADPRMGAAGSAINITGFKEMLHVIDVTGGVLADESLEIIQAFFKAKRNKKNNDKTHQ